jgi:hypothetical protein
MNVFVSVCVSANIDYNKIISLATSFCDAKVKGMVPIQGTFLPIPVNQPMDGVIDA